MITDLKRFIAEEQPYWHELEACLKDLRDKPGQLTLEGAQRLHYLYQRASSDLVRMRTYAAEGELQFYLEQLVAQVYAEIHSAPNERKAIRPWQWLTQTVPPIFRERRHAFFLATVLMMLGMLVGAILIAWQPDAKAVIMPFDGLNIDPSQRVQIEESQLAASLQEGDSSFAASLMTHNIRISILMMVLGLTWGIGTSLLLFYNGVILGAVAWDYIQAGEANFLFGWLLPHGSVEIPAMLLAGQAGFLLAKPPESRGRR